jgi:two-component system chemotaxis response regulator CheY
VQPRKVLAVDDSKLMLKMYEVMLRSVPVVLAADGQEALDQLRRNPDIDLVLLDINMPVMTGYDVLSRLAAEGTLGRLTVVIVTTEGEDEDIRRGLAAGATAYLTKPFQADQVLRAIAGLRRGGAA